MLVVDPHVHFWDLREHHYPWLANPGKSFVGDASDLKHNYLPVDLTDDAAGIELLQVVHVEANYDPANPVGETRWLQSLADARRGRDFPNAIVAAADLSRPDAAAVLEGHLAYANTRGIRQILNRHPDANYNYVQHNYLHDDLWRRNFGLLGRYGLSFDLQLYPSQMADAAALARAHPNTLLILNHAGMFVDRDSVAGYRAWRDGLRLLASCENIYVKISGLAMFDHRWTVESLRPYVLETIDAFGVERSMFASNFPVDRLFGNYSTLWKAYAAIVAGASAEERDALFRTNAQRVYRI
jgi:predicted TIM-barrel fold metal-dependent hydrolase